MMCLRRPLAEVPGSSGRAAGEERVIAALLNTSGRVGGQSYYDWHILQHVCCCFATGRPTDRRATLDSCDMVTSARQIVVVVFFAIEGRRNRTWNIEMTWWGESEMDNLCNLPGNALIHLHMHTVALLGTDLNYCWRRNICWTTTFFMHDWFCRSNCQPVTYVMPQTWMIKLTMVRVCVGGWGGGVSRGGHNDT